MGRCWRKLSSCRRPVPSAWRPTATRWNTGTFASRNFRVQSERISVHEKQEKDTKGILREGKPRNRRNRRKGAESLSFVPSNRGSFLCMYCRGMQAIFWSLLGLPGRRFFFSEKVWKDL